MLYNYISPGAQLLQLEPALHKCLSLADKRQVLGPADMALGGLHVKVIVGSQGMNSVLINMVEIDIGE